MASFSATILDFRRLRMLVGLVVFLVGLAALGGCERGGPPVSREISDQTNGEVRQEIAAVSGAESAFRVEEEKAVAPVKAADSAEPKVSCRLDVECTGYLRCIQEVCAVPPAVTGVHDAQTPVVVFRKGQDRASEEVSRFYVELAVSAQEQQRGLMYRRSMQPEWGMLFIYPYDDHHAFWMKNTLISLDMVFVNSQGLVVGVVEGAEPLTLSRREVDDVSRYILELNAGGAAKAGIGEGVWMSFENIDKEHAPQF